MYCLSEVRTQTVPGRAFRVRSTGSAEGMRAIPAPELPLPPTPRCSDEALRALLSALPDAVIIVDAGERVLFATPATQRVLQHPPEKLVGQPIGLTLVTDETTEVGVIRPDGTHRVLEMRVRPMTWEGRPARVVSLRDVTERSHVEDDIRRGIAREVGRATCARVARDYRDLLTTVLCGAQLLEEAARDDHEVGSLAQKVVASAREASQLTKRLLSVSGDRVRTTRSASLDDAVRAFDARMRPLLAEGIDFDISLNAARYQVTLETKLLDEILAQLIQNACDALPRDGRLTVATCVREIPGDGTGVAPGHYAVVSVEDTGRGMNQETREHLFEPYYSTKDRRRGRGLGLAQVHGLVQQAGGFIEVRSSRNAGTRVEVLLPLVNPPQRGEVPITEPAQTALSDQTILLAEDEEGIRRLLGEVLENAGATVIHAADAREAEAILGDAGRTVDLLITDVRMPGGTGLDLIRTARADGSQLPAILISGYTAHMPLGRVPPGATEFLPKPFLPGALLELAAGMLTG